MNPQPYLSRREARRRVAAMGVLCLLLGTIIGLMLAILFPW